MKILVASQSFGNMSRKPLDSLIEAGIEVTPNIKKKKFTEEELLETVADYDGIVVGAEPVTRKVMERGKKLKILAKSGVGIDNIDLQAATEKGIFITTTPGTVEHTVADSAFALILALARNISQGDAALRKGQWPRMMGMEVWGKRLGVVGLGRIGKQVVLRARGFNMEILGYDPYPDQAFCSANGVTVTGLSTLLSTSDIITLHAPYTPETENLINADTLALLQPHAFLVNTARGGLIDEAALYQALKNKKIGGAALDCFKKEPPGSDFPFYELDNCVMTPHTAGYSPEANLKSGMLVVENIMAVFTGRTPPCLINKNVLERR